jgi:hypothetical protein
MTCGSRAVSGFESSTGCVTPDEETTVRAAAGFAPGASGAVLERGVGAVEGCGVTLGAGPGAVEGCGTAPGGVVGAVEGCGATLGGVVGAVEGCGAALGGVVGAVEGCGGTALGGLVGAVEGCGEAGCAVVGAVDGGGEAPVLGAFCPDAAGARAPAVDACANAALLAAMRLNVASSPAAIQADRRCVLNTTMSTSSGDVEVMPLE